MSALPQRAAMLPITRRVRAYFAPLQRSTGSVSVFDPAKSALFQLDAPPAPWVDMGWIENFQRSSGALLENGYTGAPAAPALQFRSRLEARVEFDFCEWGKLQMALAGGSQHLNVLASDPSADPQPSGGSPLPPVAVLPGSTASEIIFGAGAIDSFAQGDLLAIDVDYQQQTGYVGAGISAAYIRDPDDVRRDPDYIRRVTFNVGRVAQKTAASVLLAQSLLGGVPAGGAAAQKVVAFLDREGGSFFQQWSALFVFSEDSGGRICFYYPRLSPCTPAKTGFPRENALEISQPIRAVTLHAAFTAYPSTDLNDGEAVLCYRSYFPAAAAALY